MLLADLTGVGAAPQRSTGVTTWGGLITPNSWLVKWRLTKADLTIVKQLVSGRVGSPVMADTNVHVSLTKVSGTEVLSYSFMPFFSLLFAFIFISWRLITLQYCRGFCHTLT